MVFKNLSLVFFVFLRKNPYLIFESKPQNFKKMGTGKMPFKSMNPFSSKERILVKVGPMILKMHGHV